jgi:secreted PhoX family phosphatase
MRDNDRSGSNPSDNISLNALIQARVSRRAVLAGGLGAVALGFLNGTGASLLGSPAGAAPAPTPLPRGGDGGLLGFAPVPAGNADAFVVPEGYTAQVLIPWGQPLNSSGPAFKFDGSNTAAEQEQQIGAHHDGIHYFPLAAGTNASKRGVLVLNHEYIDRTLHYSDGDAEMTVEKVNKALAAHGVTVIKVVRQGGSWKSVDAWRNRRITGHTPVTFSGPVTLAHPALQTPFEARGTLNNCAHGFTPWGTYLACEENFNGYFGTQAPFTPSPLQARYGVSAAGFGYRWHLADPRFDVATNPNELNRFGWVVEIDPHNPSSTPVKRTALGRIKHEGATTVVSRGRAVVYMGDDEDGDYLYKFVSSERWRKLLKQGKSPLDHGSLHVAKFAEDGSGEWLPLVFGQAPFTAANGWADQADVCLRTRQAADAAGATKLDRPEWISVHPRTQDVYFTMTNGTQPANAINTRAPNPYGQIVRLAPDGADHTATTFDWDIFVLAGDPQYDPTVTLADDDIFGSPDGLFVDPDGRMWIQTDISNSSQNLASRGYDRIGNNQMLAADPDTGEIRRFLVGPRGCEITGVTMTPDQKAMFVNVQHPGESSSWIGSPTPANPRLVSNWPDFDPAGRPRSATVVIRRTDGGKVGT